VSTKIYHGWTWRARLHRPALAALRGFAMAAAVARIKKHAAGYAKTYLLPAVKRVIRRRKLTCSPRQLLGDLRVNMALRVAIESSRSKFRANELDVDASLNLWLHGRNVYAIGYGDCWNDLPPLAELCPAIRDFSYWDNAGRPADVSRRQWAARRKTWDAVCLDESWDATRLVHTIVNVAGDRGVDELALLVRPTGNLLYMVPGDLDLTEVE